ncbi:MAG: glycosyltransferase family 4 protein, partial [Nitrospinae bacterium]|nr:glycosyltransferase family 4 protein [Nitrospinota bacterium]
MKILFITKKFYTNADSSSYTPNIARQLFKRKHEVNIMAAEWEKGEKNESVQFLDTPSFPMGLFIRQLTFTLSAKVGLVQDKFDIIQTNELVHGQDIYRAGNGCFREWIDLYSGYISSLEKFFLGKTPYAIFMKMMEKMTFNKDSYKKIVAISKLGKEEIIKHYKVPAKDIKVIYNGVDLKRFKPASDQLKEEVRREFSLDKNDFVLLFVGSDWERQGLKFLLDVFARLEKNNLKLLVVGTGKQKKYKKLIPQDKIDKVIFTGMIKEPEKVYKCADVFVLPALYEPFGNAHLEAMSSGLPVITTSRSGAAEIIKHTVNGFVVEKPEDIDSL